MTEAIRETIETINRTIMQAINKTVTMEDSTPTVIKTTTPITSHFIIKETKEIFRITGRMPIITAQTTPINLGIIGNIIISIPTIDKRSFKLPMELA